MNASLREMRDQVYGQRGSDNNWINCVDFWQRDKDWMRAEYAKLPRPLPPLESLPLTKTT
jgi:hypothetical protein